MTEGKRILLYEAIAIRDCRKADLKSVQEIENSSFDDPYSPSIFSSFMDERAIFRIASVGETTVGYCVVACLSTSKAVVVSLAVRSDFKKKGIGSALIRDAVELLKLKYPRVISVELQVSVSNFAAISLYSKLGFTEKRTMQNYYGPCKDGKLMSLSI